MSVTVTFVSGLADVAGRATLVVFFFPSCTYCAVAYPAMQKLHEDYRERGLTLVWINTLPEQEDKVPAWIVKHHAGVPVLVGSTRKALEKDYGLRMAPTIMLVGADGKVLYKHAGYKAGDEKALEQAIRQALDGAA